MKITDTTEKKWPEMSKNAEADRGGRHCVLWFDTNGMGPSVHDWTVRAFREGEDTPKPRVGIEFSQLGGPYFDVETAIRLRRALGAAIAQACGLSSDEYDDQRGDLPIFETPDAARAALERCFGPLALENERNSGSLWLRRYRANGGLGFVIATVDGSGSTCGVVTKEP